MIRFISLVRLAALLGVALLGARSPDSTRAAEPAPQFPYSAFVAVSEASVRSGPGETYYPTLNLKVGDAVEVWRHDPGGWLAVRPPEGAFSWISADFIQQTGEKTGRVTGNEVNVRVGTKFSDLRDAIQLQLSVDDEVEILESRTLRTGDQETLWYKILPPAGEFRWIASRHVVLHPSQLPPAAEPNLATSKIDSGVRQASFDAPVAFETPSVDLSAALKAIPANASVDVQIDEMESIVSRMVTVEPTAWSFTEMKQRAEAALENSDSALDRSKARAFLAKLARLEDIQKRYASIAQVREQTATVDRELAKQDSAVTPTAGTERGRLMLGVGVNEAVGLITDLAADEPQPALKTGVDTTRYDGVGRLMIVVDGKPGTPGYALANRQGELAAYVVAAPGMNLRQYVGLDVGINGIRGFATDQRIEQLTAKRIDVLGSRQAESGSRVRRR